MYTEKQLNDLSANLQRSQEITNKRIDHLHEASDALRAFNNVDRLQLGSVIVTGFLPSGQDAVKSEILTEPLPQFLRDQLKEWLQAVCEWHAVQGYQVAPAPVLFPDLEKNRGRCVLDPPPAKSL